MFIDVYAILIHRLTCAIDYELIINYGHVDLKTPASPVGPNHWWIQSRSPFFRVAPNIPDTRNNNKLLDKEFKLFK